jgi:ABC-type antimicrobial peptide transport system permease subunit
MIADAMIAHLSSDLDLLKKMLGAFALLGLTLAALGIYRVIARTVIQRTSEIGIRMALGAQVNDVIRLIVGSGIRLALIGASIGLAGAFGLSRLIASNMPAMRTDGGLVLTGATALLIAVAFASCWPARRAT